MAKIAVFLAEKLKEKGVVIDIDLVERACLLHDMTRLCEFEKSDYNNSGGALTDQEMAAWDRLRATYKGISHEDAAYELLKEKYPQLALTIKKHKYAALLDEKEKPCTWEERIVYYADKRVTHERIVTLKERLEEAHQRNENLQCAKGQREIDTAKIDHLIFELERQIFTKTGLNPDDVTEEFIDS